MTPNSSNSPYSGLNSNFVKLMSSFNCNKQYVAWARKWGKGKNRGKEINGVKGEADAGGGVECAVDSKHGTGVKGRSPLCTEGHHPK